MCWKKKEASLSLSFSFRLTLTFSSFFLTTFRRFASGRLNKPLMRNGCYSCPSRYFCAITIYHICLFTFSLPLSSFSLFPFSLFFLTFSLFGTYYCYRLMTKLFFILSFFFMFLCFLFCSSFFFVFIFIFNHQMI